MKIIAIFLVICDVILCNDNKTISVLIEDEESTTDPNDHIGLIRPTKDLSIWIDEDQVNENFKVRGSLASTFTYYLKITEFAG